MRRTRYEALTVAEAEAIVATLKPYLTDARKERMELSLATRTRDVALVMEDIYDEHNAGACLRSAEAFGVLENHVIAPNCRFRISRKVTSGAHKWLDLCRHSDPGSAYALLERRGYQIWAADVRDAVPIHELPSTGRLALVFGNEHKGLSEEARKAAHGRFRIPMHGFVESFNISVATAVSLHHVVEGRRTRGELTMLSPQDVLRLRAAWYAKSLRAAGQILEEKNLPRPVMWSDPMITRERNKEEEIETP